MPPNSRASGRSKREGSRTFCPPARHFDGDEWTWLRGCLSTIDRTMGARVVRRARVLKPWSCTAASAKRLDALLSAAYLPSAPSRQDAVLHHIVDSHVVHHIFSDMPFYGAKAATPYVKEKLGIYYKSVPPTPVLGSDYLGYWRDFYHMMKASVSVGREEDSEFFWFH